MPKAHSKNWLATPARPNSKIKPSPTTNGGVMIGSMASTLSGLAYRWLARSAISAINVPNTTVNVAVINPRNKVFQATPQRWPPTTQLRPKLRWLAMRPHIAQGAKVLVPSSVCVKNAALSALSTGNIMKSANSAAQPSTAAAMNRSPLKYPRLAVPNAVNTTSDTSTTTAPQPMPN